MGMRVNDVAGAVERAHAAMAYLEQDLNEADSKLGDGDTGSMLARVMDASQRWISPRTTMSARLLFAGDCCRGYHRV